MTYSSPLRLESCSRAGFEQVPFPDAGNERGFGTALVGGSPRRCPIRPTPSHDADLETSQRHSSQRRSSRRHSSFRDYPYRRHSSRKRSSQRHSSSTPSSSDSEVERKSRRQRRSRLLSSAARSERRRPSRRQSFSTPSSSDSEVERKSRRRRRIESPAARSEKTSRRSRSRELSSTDAKVDRKRKSRESSWSLDTYDRNDLRDIEKSLDICEMYARNIQTMSHEILNSSRVSLKLSQVLNGTPSAMNSSDEEFDRESRIRRRSRLSYADARLGRRSQSGMLWSPDARD